MAVGFLLACCRLPAELRRANAAIPTRGRLSLDGITVLDFSRLVAGNMLSLQLADFGAEVVKVEDPAAPIYDIDQFVADPHVQARQIVVDVPDEEIGSVTVHNVIPRLSATPGALRRPAPKLGEHTAEILARVGIDADQLSVLRDEGIIV